jgi:hypothetical protein
MVTGYQFPAARRLHPFMVNGRLRTASPNGNFLTLQSMAERPFLSLPRKRTRHARNIYATKGTKSAWA